MKFLAPFLTVLQPWHKYDAHKWSKSSICITIFTYIWCLKYSVGLGLRPGAIWMLMGRSIFNIWFNLFQLEKGLVLGDESVGSVSLLSTRVISLGKTIVTN